jgi:hypothetical protein
MSAKKSHAAVALGGVAALLLSTACSGHHGSASSAVLKVNVGLYGGPPNPATGEEAETGAPIPNTLITVTRVGGRDVTGSTGSTGIAEFDLPPGKYSVSSAECGAGGEPGEVTLATGATVVHRVVCSVP